MTQREQNRKTALLIANNPFWKTELFTKYYAADFTMDIPTAPPGMPSRYNTWEAERCFAWLNWSVRKWQVTLKEFYGSPAESFDTYWAIGRIHADVCWGEHNGIFESDSYMKICFKNGKVNYLSWRMDPVAMLLAAGRKRPSFDVEQVVTTYDFSDVKPWKSLYTYHQEYSLPSQGNDDQGIKERLFYNLEQHRCGIEREKYRQCETQTEDYQGDGYFIPQQQCDAAEAHKDEWVGGRPIVLAWVKASSPWMYRDPRNKVYATDDAHIYFAEMNNHGPGCWIGVGQPNGHYHQDYLVYIRVDEYGRICEWKEILNAVNIFNSSAIVMESFPYYY